MMRDEQVHLTTHNAASHPKLPLGMRVLVAADAVLATTFGLLGALDVSFVWLILPALVCPAAYGVFRRQRWGWWWSVGVHIAVLALGLLAYVGVAVATWDDMDRPRGHMELISPAGFLKLATIAAVAYMGVAAVPLCYLFRKKVRAAFRAQEETTSLPEDRPTTPVA